MRAVVRSTSLTPRSASRSAIDAGLLQAPRSHRAARGPRGVRAAAASATGARRGCPCRCGRCRAATAGWARLRRAASASVRGCGAWWAAAPAVRWRRCTASVRTCAAADPAVGRARWCARRSSAGPRRRPGPRADPAALKPARLGHLQLLAQSLRAPSAASNCQAGRCVTGTRACCSEALARSRSTSTSAGARRASQAAEFALAAFGQAELRRCVSASQARP